MPSNSFSVNARTTADRQPSAGYLYYVRLNTSLGVFYKLGFTTLGSVQERFAFQRKGHDALISEVLVFSHREDAYEVEQLLHEHFRNKATFRMPEEGMPFFENGQSEIYAEDILDMDWDFAKGRVSREDTQQNVLMARAKRHGLSEAEIHERREAEKDAQEVVRALSKLFKWPIRLFHFIEEWNCSSIEKKRRARIREVIADLQARKHAHWRKWQQRELDILKDPYAALKADIKAAIAAFKRHDLQEFESIIHVPLLAYNLAEAMTADKVMGSDYLITANNCGLIALMEAMEVGTPRDLLMKPVEETYKALLRVLVREGRILREDIIVPDDPRYKVCEGFADESEPHPLSSMYGLQNYLDLFGRHWNLPDNPAFRDQVGSVEFDLAVFNSVTGFNGALTINAMYIGNHKISLSFPNFLDLDEAASKKKKAWEKSVGLRDPNEPELAHRNQFRREFGF